MGKYLLKNLEFMLDMPHVNDVRGMGLMVGIEFDESCSEYVKDVLKITYL